MHTVIVANDKIFGSGQNHYGQLGLDHDIAQSNLVQLGTHTNDLLMQGVQIRQIAIGLFHTIILKENNDILVFGYNNNGQLGLGHNESQKLPILLMQKIPICQIACGAYHTVILQDNNNVLVFGQNDEGQLGLSHNGITK